MEIGVKSLLLTKFKCDVNNKDLTPKVSNNIESSMTLLIYRIFDKFQKLQHILLIVTDRMDLPPELIALIYRYR